MAQGMIYLLCQWCWSNSTDIIGDAKQVGKIVGNFMPAQPLARLLQAVGILEETKRYWFCRVAFAERPVYVDSRWRRVRPSAFRQAKRRSATGSSDDAAEAPEDMVELDDYERTDLFGNPIKDEEPKKKKRERRKRGAKDGDGTPGFNELKNYWCQQWKEIVGGGVDYPWSFGLDGRCLKSLISRTREPEQAKAVIDAYLRCRDSWYIGKPFKKLIGDLPRFVKAADWTPPVTDEGPPDSGETLPSF